jgi:fatty-acyl-CoA synthase
MIERQQKSSHGSPELAMAWGGPLTDEPALGALTVPGYLIEVCERFADHEALVFSSSAGTTRWSYTDVLKEAEAIARALIAAGVSRDTRVGILMTNRPQLVAAAFGCAMAGGIFVLLNTFSTPDELDYQIKVADLGVLLIERYVVGKDFSQILASLEPELDKPAFERLSSIRWPYLRQVVAFEDAQQCTDGPLGIGDWRNFLAQGDCYQPEVVRARASSVCPADAAAIFFSSGTTSLPKGIVHSHRALCVQWWRWPRMYSDGRGDLRVWNANAMFWSGPFSMCIGNAFSSGGAMVLQSIFNPTEALDLFQSERVTLPLARRHQWAQIEELPEFATADLSQLRCFDFRLHFQKEQSSLTTDYVQPKAFGTTETLTNIVSTIPTEPRDDDAGFGRPLPGNTIKIIDPLSGQTLAAGECGELAIKGPTLMMHYLGKAPEDCFDHEGFYCTGDRASIDSSGNLIWEGRMTDMIKTGGANVAPDEVDEVIKRYPGIKMTKTLGLPDDMLGEIVVSCVVAQRGELINESDLRTFLKTHLASYKIPKEIFVVEQEDVALTGSGAKIKVNDLRELAAEKLAARRTSKP